MAFNVSSQSFGNAADTDHPVHAVTHHLLLSLEEG